MDSQIVLQGLICSSHPSNLGTGDMSLVIYLNWENFSGASTAQIQEIISNSGLPDRSHRRNGRSK